MMAILGNKAILEARSIIDLLDHHASARGDSLAIAFKGGPGAPAGDMTFAGLALAARRIAVALGEVCQPGDRALLLLPSGLDYVLALLGCLHAKVIAVPVNLPGPARVARVLSRIAPIIGDCEPAVILTTEAITLSSRAGLQLVCAARPSCHVLSVDRLPHDPADWRRPNGINQDTIAFLQYTSGSTGAPKGVINFHGGLLHNNVFMARLTAMRAGSVMASWLPLYHDMGLIGGVLHPLCYGATSVLMAPASFIGDPLRWLEVATEHQATQLPGSASGFQLCLERASEDRLARLDLGAVEAAMPAAEPVLPELIRSMIRILGPVGLRPEAIRPCYGLAEATLLVAGSTKGDLPVVKTVDRQGIEAGRMLPVALEQNGRSYVSNGTDFGGQELRIVDPKTCRPMPDGMIGEIWVAGPSIARGYWNNEAATDQTFRARLDLEPGTGPDGTQIPLFLRTGDLGTILDGNLFITGRQKDMMLFFGRCHYPNDIEATCWQADPHAVTGGAAAFSVTDEAGAEHLVVVSEVERPARPDPVDWNDVLGHLRLAIGQEHELRVHEIVLIRKGTLERTSSGKVRRKAMRAAWQNGNLKVIARRFFDHAPSAKAAIDETSIIALRERVQQEQGSSRRQALEALLVALLAAELGLPVTSIRPDRPLLALGLDSISAMAIAKRLNQLFAISCALPSFLDMPTAKALAAEIEKMLGEDMPAAPIALLVPDPANRDQPFRLTDLQHAYWTGRGGSFSLGQVSCHGYVELDSEGLDLARLERAWNRLIRRHDALRLVIEPDGRQRILMDVPHYQIETADLRYADGERIRAHLSDRREQLSHQLLPADQWPLFTLEATRLPAMMTRIHIAIDMLIVDAASIGILWRELERLYQADGDPDQAGLSPLTLSIRDYVQALDAPAFSQESQKVLARDYWLERLDELPDGPDLPLAIDPAKLERQRFVRHAGRLVPERWAIIKQRAAHHGLTPAAVLLAAFAEVIAAWSTSERFSLVLTLFERQPFHPEVAGLLGDFTGITVLAVEPKADAGFAANARALHRRLLTDLEHRAFSGVEVMRAKRRLSGDQQPLLPVVFTSELGVDGTSRVKGSKSALGRQVYGISQTPQVWLDHQVQEQGGGLDYNWDLVEALFSEGMPSAMFESFAHLLEQLAGDDDVWDRPAAPPLPAAQVRSRREVNATAKPLSPALLQQPFEHWAARTPKAVALQAADGRSWRYDELDRWRRQLARRVALQLEAQEAARVGILMEKGPEQVAACLAILGIGKVFVPLDPEWPDSRLKTILEKSGITLLLVQAALEAELATRLPGARLLPADEQRLEDEQGPADEQVLATVALKEPTDPAYIIYTSGSTGTPKGVIIDHRGALNTVLDINDRFAIRADDVVLGVSSLTFDLSIYDIFGTLAAGACLVLPAAADRRDPAHWAELCRAHKVTVWNSVPALMDLLLEENDHSAIKTMRVILLSGDWVPLTLPQRLRAAAPDARLICLGGATEASIWSNWFDAADLDPAWPSVPYGYPLANQGYRILDDLGRDRPDWVPGHLCITGAGLAHGYADDPQKTAKAFVIDGTTGQRLYRTGDIGRYRPGGIIEFLGRRDRQVKIAGHRIELGEIEAALNSHPAVREAVVDAVGEDRHNRRLVAWYVQGSGRRSAAPGPSAHFDRERWDLANRAREVVAREVVEGADLPMPARAYEAIWDLLRDLTGRSISDSLRAAGIDPAPGGNFDRAAAIAAFRPKSSFLPLVEQWLDFAGEHQDWPALIAKANRFGLPPALLHRLRDGAADRLSILRGELDPLSLFAASDRNILAPEDLAAINPLAPAVHRAIALVTAERLAGSGELQVLQIGVGSGRTSFELLESLPAKGLVYTIADHSRTRLNEARALLGDAFPGHDLRTQSFDPDQPATVQEIGAMRFDIIIASQALHRTQDLPRLLASLRMLLAPKGLLMAAEMTRNTPLQLVTVALLEHGFAKLADFRRDARSPLLAAPAWQEVFADAGFGRIEALAPDEAAGKAYGLHLLLAEAPDLEGGLDVDDLRRHAAARLPGYMVPALFILIEQLPLTANGKIDRKRLPRPKAAPAAKEKSAPPATPLEELIAGSIASLLGIDAVGRDDDFFTIGGDSLLAVRLIERLRSACGRALAVKDVFEAQSVRALAQRLEAAGLRDDGGFALVADQGNRFAPFPLTDVQQAYWVGREAFFTECRVSTYLFTEIDVEGLAPERLVWAWQRLIERHDMLRAVIDEEGVQRVLREVPIYEPPVRDLRDRFAAQIEEDLLPWREAMAQQVLPTDRWPVFDVRLALLPGNGVRLFVGLDNLICDGASMQLLCREWSALARGGEAALAALPDLSLSFRDHVLALHQHEKTEAYQKSLDFWMSRIERLPKAPELPLLDDPEQLQDVRFKRYRGILKRPLWQALKARASHHGVTLNAVLLAAFGQTLAGFTSNPAFTLNLTVFHRPPVHPQIEEVVGDFTSLILLGFNHAHPLPFVERVRAVQQELGLVLEHARVSTVRVLREDARRRAERRPRRFPVVFTSALHAGSHAADMWGDVAPLGRFGYGLTQTPQVVLDHQVVERDGALDYNFDYLAALFEPAMLDAMFAAHGRLLQSLADDEAWQQPLAPSSTGWQRPLPSITPAGLTAAPAAADPGEETLSFDAARKAILYAFEEVLDHDDIPEQVNFFELGATSLTLIRVRRRLQQRLGLRFPVIETFAHPTISLLAARLAWLAGQPDQSPALLVPRDAPPTPPDLPDPDEPMLLLGEQRRAERRRSAKRQARTLIRNRP